ncbi:MAG: aminotransferase class IV [Firmicutes bacterium]|nr:aminotransferase class IV [Bacillota bacterium]
MMTAGHWSWYNGALTINPTICGSDRGFLYGDGVFETILVREGRPVFLPAHLARLGQGAAALGIVLPYSERALAEAVTAVVRQNGISTGAVRLTVSRGPGERGLAPAGNLRPTVLVAATPGLPYGPKVYEEGLAAVLLPWPRNERSPLSRIKSTSCAENVLGAMAAERAGADEGIFLNTSGYLAEGTKTNLFLVKDGEVLTPPVEAGALPGIVRALVLASFPVRERMLALEDLFAAEEAFLTNSLLGVAPLVRVNGHALADGRLGPVTGRVMEVLTRRSSIVL